MLLAMVASPVFSDGGAVQVGVVLPLSGPRSNFGTEALKGINLAAQIINERGGINDRQLVLLVSDNMGDPSQTAQKVTAMVLTDSVLAIVGPITSTNAAAAAAVAQEHQTPLILPVATSPFVTEIGEYIIRICVTDPFQSKALAAFSRNGLKATRAAIIYEKGSDYSEKLAQYYSLRFSDMGGEIVFSRHITPDSGVLPASVDAALALEPDLLFLPLYYPEAVQAVKYLNAREKAITVLGGDGWDSPELFRLAGESIRPGQIFISSHYSPDLHTEIGDKFVERFQREFESPPNAISALGFDALMVLADAVGRSTVVTRSGVRDALVTTEDFQGVTGSITINEKRNVLKDVFILEAFKDHFALYTRISNF